MFWFWSISILILFVKCSKGKKDAFKKFSRWRLSNIKLNSNLSLKKCWVLRLWNPQNLKMELLSNGQKMSWKMGEISVTFNLTAKTLSTPQKLLLIILIMMTLKQKSFRPWVQQFLSHWGHYVKKQWTHLFFDNLNGT